MEKLRDAEGGVALRISVHIIALLFSHSLPVYNYKISVSLLVRKNMVI